MDQFPNDGDVGAQPTPSASSDTLGGLSHEFARPDHGRPRLTGRVGRALPGAIAGVLLIGAIAFGATTARPDLSGTSNGQAAGGAQSADGATGGGSTAFGGASHGANLNGEETGPGAGGGDGTGAGTGDGQGDGQGTEPTDHPGTEPTDGPGDGVEPGAKPDPTEQPDPTRKPGGESMNLVLSVTDGGNVKVDWTRCTVDGAVAYKVVRTTDGGIKWPFGGADHQIALVTNLAETALIDTEAPAGKTVLYRVFCVGGHDGDWTFLDSTPGRTVHVPGDEPKPTPKPEPTPTPQTMSLHLENSESGGVYIGWSTCVADGFSAYKVVRSPDESTTWPLGGNDKLVAYITDRSLTHFVDTDVEAGGHYFYRVFCVKATGDSFKILNSTHVEDFTVPAS